MQYYPLPFEVRVTSNDLARSFLGERTSMALALSGKFEGSSVVVSTTGDHVTLMGTVGAEHDSRTAEDVVRRVPGVHSVTNRLRLQR
jgi:osmotically-inducible protein OsmY